MVIVIIIIIKIGIMIIAYNKIVSMIRIMVEIFSHSSVQSILKSKIHLLSVITKVETVDLVLSGNCQSYNYA